MASPVNNRAWLEWLTALTGGVSRQAYAATLPPDRFCCLLDDLPLHLIPLQKRQVDVHVNRETDQLFLNRRCTLLPAGQVPEEFESRRELLRGFPEGETIAWVRDEARETLLPFWLGPRLEREMRNIGPGEVAPATLAQNDRQLLAAAGILTSNERLDRGRREWEEMVRNLSPQFRERGYSNLASLIHPFHVAALRRYYRYLIRSGAVHLGDGQSSRRYVAYNEPVARFFHHSLAPMFSTLAGEFLKPSYVYMASYLSGAELKKHTDREQCEFSITLCLDFSPEPAAQTRWPIHLDAPTGITTTHQALGDGLAYRGTRLPHYREPLGEGLTSTSIFFHYVPIDFEGSLD
jgi:hypothetical protein